MDYQHRTRRSRSIDTEDRLLGGRVRLFQPKTGYRVAIDPVFLASAVRPRGGERVLDAGCGTGAAALCLAARTRHEAIVGVELDPHLSELARRNAVANGTQSSIGIVEASFREFAAEHRGQFDQVMTNPPFHAAGTHTSSPNSVKAAAHGEQALDLKGWIDASCDALKAGGKLTLIHRADRLGAILAHFENRFGAVSIFPLWPRSGVEANRVIVRATKGRRSLPRLMAGLVLHREDGTYTDDADRVLRDAAALDLDQATD